MYISFFPVSVASSLCFMKAEIVFVLEMKVIGRDTVIIHNDFSQQALGCPCHSKETHCRDVWRERFVENYRKWF